MQPQRKAIIVGSGGQDGRLLTAHLQNKNYDLTLLARGDVDITDAAQVRDLVSRVLPDEVYFLAAYHHSSQDSKVSDGILFQKSFEVHVGAAINFLEAISQAIPTARFFYASSSHIFPDSAGLLQNEATPPQPQSVYAITKYSGMMACHYYRETKNIFAACGILFNHESNLRNPKYLSRKVVMAAAQIAQKKSGALVLGDLEAVVDWGYAPDYVDAMHRILQLKTPSDYVIATGEPHTVREFIQIAFECVGLNCQDHLQIEPSLLTRSGVTRIGDAGKLNADTGWKPSLSFKDMVTQMVRWEQGK